ncbi:glycosyltransferase family 4 protein [Thermovibrio ammonificans]
MFTINATHIGEKLDGIGRFSLYLAKHFLKRYRVVVNKRGTKHFSPEERRFLKVASPSISPDLGRVAHIRRLLFSSTLKGKVLNLSQMETSFWNSEQIVVVHDIIPLLFPEEHKFQYPFYRYVLPKILKNRCKLIVTVSKHTKQTLINNYGIPGEKITVIYNGIELPSERKERKENFILFVGRNGPNKNLKTLIKAFKRLRELHPHLKLVIAGCKVEESAGIVSLGYVENSELDRLYRKAKVFVLPSLYEGFGFPVIEAMARGTAVVTTRVSSLPEVAADAALYVEDPKNPRELAEKIDLLLKNRELRTKLETKGLKRAKLFSVEGMVKEYDELLRSMS